MFRFILFAHLPHFFCRVLRITCYFRTADESGQFIDGFLRVKSLDPGDRRGICHILCNAVMSIRHSGDLRQMRNADDLPAMSNHGHFLSYTLNGHFYIIKKEKPLSSPDPV